MIINIYNLDMQNKLSQDNHCFDQFQEQINTKSSTYSSSDNEQNNIRFNQEDSFPQGELTCGDQTKEESTSSNKKLGQSKQQEKLQKIVTKKSQIVEKEFLQFVEMEQNNQEENPQNQETKQKTDSDQEFQGLRDERKLQNPILNISLQPQQQPETLNNQDSPPESQDETKVQPQKKVKASQDAKKPERGLQKQKKRTNCGCTTTKCESNKCSCFKNRKKCGKNCNCNRSECQNLQNALLKEQRKKKKQVNRRT